MIDTYILLNRKPTKIVKLFIYINILFIFLIIYVLFNVNYTSFFSTNALIINHNNYSLLKIKTSIKNIKNISNNNKLIINNNEYIYKLDKIDSDIIIKNGKEYQVLYLKIFYLKNNNFVDNYYVDIKIPNKSKKIIEYLK